jgi:serine/threonine-protein kinase
LTNEARQTRVLVVDDSAVARHALTTVLQGEGFAVESAGSAFEARQTIERRGPGAFDLILMDLHLPDGTGTDTCAHIKRLPGWEDVPVIVVTSSDDEHDLSLAFAAEATDYITKPPRDLELRARVRAALRLKQEMNRRQSRERELEQLNRQLSEQAEALSAARTQLLDLNRTLERRVQAQVEKILTHAREIDALNAQLRVQVQERSRELAEALRRLSVRESDRPALVTGTVLSGRVRLVRSLGRGGMGQVFLAEDLLTGSRVAVKLLDPRIDIRARGLQRFIDEAAAAAAIEHPAIVKTLHVDISEDGDPFLIMEFVEGATLAAVLAEGPLSTDRCISIGHMVADALAAAHRAGVVHRDIKPSNLIVCAEPPGVRVLDFGISKSLSVSHRGTWTQTGGMLGTPAYMSPEQFQDAAAVTPASDVFSLGAVLFEMTTGSLLFPGRGVREPLRRPHRADPHLPHHGPDVPARLASLVDRCLAHDPAARPSARELTDQLAALAVALNTPAATDSTLFAVGTHR